MNTLVRNNKTKNAPTQAQVVPYTLHDIWDAQPYNVVLDVTQASQWQDMEKAMIATWDALNIQEDCGSTSLWFLINKNLKDLDNAQLKSLEPYFLQQTCKTAVVPGATIHMKSLAGQAV